MSENAKTFWQKYYNAEMQRIEQMNQLRCEGRTRQVAAMAREGKRAAAERIAQAKRYLAPMWQEAKRLRLYK